MSLYAGAARIEITPPPGQPMAGFPPLNTEISGGPRDTSGYFGREGVATDTHDPLYARALVLDDGQRTLALVTVDLVAVSTTFTDAIREAVHEAIEVPPEHLLIAASHTHSGPDLFRWAEGLDSEVTPEVQRRVVEVVCQAHTSRRPARIGWADGHLEQISINRRDPAGPIDPSVGVMWIEDEHEEPIALAVNFAVHTCMLSAANLLYSADISGYAMTALERVYPGAVALFLNGAAGNINPVAYPWGPKENVVPAFRKAWHAGRPHPRTFRNTARLGHILAGAALQTAEQVQERYSELALSGAIRPVTLPLKPPEELAQFRTFMGLGPNFAGTRLDAQMLNTEVQALAVGPALYVGLPGEPFVELGLDLQQRLRPARTYVVGYANDDARYILPKAEYKNNRYETWGSMVAAGSGEILVEAAEKIAQEIQPTPEDNHQ